MRPRKMIRTGTAHLLSVAVRGYRSCFARLRMPSALFECAGCGRAEDHERRPSGETLPASVVAFNPLQLRAPERRCRIIAAHEASMIVDEELRGVFILDWPETRDDRWDSRSEERARQRRCAFGIRETSARRVASRENRQAGVRQPTLEQLLRSQHS